MRAIERIRHAVGEERFRISSHANEEMSNDKLELEDIVEVLVKGESTHTFTHDPRGERYEITGETKGGRRASIVCRFLGSGVLLVITVYAHEQ